MNNNLLTAPRSIPDIIIVTALGNDKYVYDNLILNSFSQRIRKGDLWNSKGDTYTISFSTIPEQLLKQLEHGGYQISEIKFIFTHKNLDDNKCYETERTVILTNPSIDSLLTLDHGESGHYHWTIYNTWTNYYDKRD